MAPVDETRLDDVEALEALDSRETLRALASAGAHVRRAALAAHEAGVSETSQFERPRSVLVAALGGSAVVCEVLDALAEPSSPIPVTTRGSGPLPGWIGPLDLVIAVSQSGHAAGPVGLAAEAARRGASVLTVGAGNSPLAEVCARARGIHVDPGIQAPTSRTALWALATPVLIGCAAYGLIAMPGTVLDGLADRLDEIAEECRPGSDAFVNPAKVLAAELADTVPIVLGDGPLGAVAASRAASMLSRTARMPAMSGALPDDAARIVACLDGPYAAGASGPGSAGSGRDIFADPFLDGPPTPRLGLLALRDPEAAADAAALADAVLESARAVGASVSEVMARGEHRVERLASLMAITDFATTYLALGLGLDPAVSRHVTDLRDRTR